MADLKIRLQGPVALAVLAGLVLYVGYGLLGLGLKPRESRCEGYSGTVVSKDDEYNWFARSHLNHHRYSIVVRSDAGTETRYEVSNDEWGRLPVGFHVEKKPGCSEATMTAVSAYLRAHPEVLERMRK